MVQMTPTNTSPNHPEETMMETLLQWLHQLRSRPGQFTGSISFWLKGQNQSYTLLLSTEGVELKQPGLRTADLVLSMTPTFLVSWLDGTLDPAELASGELAWDGDLRLFRDLGLRMAQTPMLPHQSMFRQPIEE
jgi:hypothetical protein